MTIPFALLKVRKSWNAAVHYEGRAGIVFCDVMKIILF